MSTQSQITLPDGRKLTYAEFGQPDGAPVLYFHGAPSSRMEPLLIGDEVFRQHGLRVIAPDRPGMGGSDFQAGRGFSDWPADVVALADSLGIERFAVLGNSGGGPYVAVCAAKISQRLRAAVIVSGGWRMDWPEAKNNMPFVNRLVMTLARRAPLLLRLLLSSMGSISQGDPEKELARLRSRLPAADYAAFAVPGRLAAFGQTMRESLRQGAKGAVWDMRLYVRDFDFSLDEIRVPITLFHGEQDTNAPLAMVRRMATGLSSARLVTYENEAHLSTLCNHFDAIAQAVADAPSKSSLL